MAAKSTFGNMVLVLSGICLVCSALLGTVYAVTTAPIEASEIQKVNAAIAAVTPSFDNVPSEAVQEVLFHYIITVYVCNNRSVICNNPGLTGLTKKDILNHVFYVIK